jgi:hypothetical protein
MLLNELSLFKAWPGQWVQLAGLLLDFAGAWWVGWCLSQLSLWQQQSTTPEMLSVLPDLAFCVQKKNYPGIFRRF